ncbi:hypothetical protein QN277_000740 [Acacia crassicarpa]|uniref:Uncharacterized protein n=1 Tax=Acacia crassicarpa TaxID=499986 RepID=A0AAE1N8A1_9FABA|nr:hypothetical protein QN277_000740 [Acacia crassicarpa]
MVRFLIIIHLFQFEFEFSDLPLSAPFWHSNLPLSYGKTSHLNSHHQFCLCKHHSGIQVHGVYYAFSAHEYW